jgi:signal transduction histidine kinase/ActR/RegA family two-component response regulator
MYPIPLPMPVDQDFRKREILSAQLGLLYANASFGAGVTVFAATILVGLQWEVVPGWVLMAWWLYMTFTSVLRFAFARKYQLREPGYAEVGKWRSILTASVALAGLGWGSAGVLLYPPIHMLNQVFLLFVLGGIMLGAASLLAPRPEAFLAFLIPTGFIPAVRLFAQGDKTHIAMGLLAVVYTFATLITTNRIYRTVESSFRLQIENQGLVEDLQAANQRTEALNEALEHRVEERTAELHRSAEQLRMEIKQREQAEDELLRARKLESLGVLAGGIAHDFNNFLTVVQGNIEIAKAQLSAEEPARGFLEQAANACHRAASLSSQLLTFAKGGDPVRRVVSLSKLVEDSVLLAGSGSPTRIEVEIQEGLWLARVDPGQIAQVLHNMFINAQQAMAHAGIIHVRATNLILPNNLEEVDHSVRISIRDNGCGISPEALNRIFDPYFTTKPNGSGLGLTTAYAIVLKHGGRISVESTPGVGTEFNIDLPACEETELPTPPRTGQVRAGQERLLLMDDVEDLRILSKAVLTQMGYDVQTAKDGAEALVLYEQARNAGKQFAAVLLDLTVVGGMGGIEAAAQLKKMDPSSKLIVSSGYSDAPVMSGYGNYGFDAVILKPWTIAEISEVLRTVLAGNPDADD